MAMDKDLNSFECIGVIATLVLIVLICCCFISAIGGCCDADLLKKQACDRGYGKWEVNTKGDSQWRWIEPNEVVK